MVRYQSRGLDFMVLFYCSVCLVITTYAMEFYRRIKGKITEST